MADPFEYDIFISFSSADEEIVKPIWQQFSSNGLKVFWSDQTLRREAGSSWFEVIEKSLERSKHMLLVCSNNSMNSKWVQREYRAFYDHCYSPPLRRLIPLFTHEFRPSNLPMFLRELQGGRINDIDFIQELIPLLGGVNIEKLRYENEMLRKQLDALLHENLLLRERLFSSEEVSNFEREQNSNSAVSSTAPFETLGLSPVATSNEIRENYESLKSEYSSLAKQSPPKLQIAYLAKLQKIEAAFSEVYDKTKQLEEQQRRDAFDFFQLEANASKEEIIDKYLAMKEAYEAAAFSPDEEIRQLAKDELAKSENVIRVLIPNEKLLSRKTPHRFVSPIVMKIAQENNISINELERLQGTGTGGRVTKTDILSYLEKRTPRKF